MLTEDLGRSLGGGLMNVKSQLGSSKTILPVLEALIKTLQNAAILSGKIEKTADGAATAWITARAEIRKAQEDLKVESKKCVKFMKDMLD